MLSAPPSRRAEQEGELEPSGADTSIGTEAPCCCFCCSEKRKITCPSPPYSLSPSLALRGLQHTEHILNHFYAETAPGTVSGKELLCMLRAFWMQQRARARRATEHRFPIQMAHVQRAAIFKSHGDPLKSATHALYEHRGLLESAEKPWSSLPSHWTDRTNAVVTNLATLVCAVPLPEMRSHRLSDSKHHRCTQAAQCTTVGFTGDIHAHPTS